MPDGKSTAGNSATASFGSFERCTHKYQSRSTPTLVIGEEVMIGFDPDRLDELMRD